ncbi:LysM peptidoglycan-binding domain-containing protein [Paenibacillus mucilaginosus]|uniref:LysM peptidoglycan-binding domain-containing protein n=1 Tax=Paenibacillus mucilaginosus TaxID=61624 RepID=UPI001F265A71|nr:LysM peptidoglycan-binding domain-containing protein [Paenibacillus mucilaginosus]MCG7212083.1 LysM peptidoglycan-binding domain-containing protein [Paenibacillus mucilaginosus]
MTLNKLLSLSLAGAALAAVCLLAWNLPAAAADEPKRTTAKNGAALTLSPKSLYVDSALPADDPANYRFRTVHAAAAAAVDGTEAEPMVIYIEPDVYPMNGTLTDRGLYIDKDWVSLVGLSADARDVVLADNRGHTIGAQSPSGSSPAETLFVTGTGFHAENLTIGNYCNVDLVYPKDPSKNQAKRSSTITQAYAIGAGNKDKVLDKFTFKNVRLISMLDTLALGEVQRAYFQDSYVQGTDDYMGGGLIHVMKNTTLHSYTNKPIYAAGKHGMAFIDSRWEIEFADPGDLTLAKNASTLYLINNAFTDLNGNLRSIQWAPYPAGHIRSYAYRTTLNGKPYRILPEENGTELTEDQLPAYTVYNLLKGEDGWNPAGENTGSAGGAGGSFPANITMPESSTIRTGEKGAELSAAIFPSAAPQHLTWSLDSDLALLSAKQGSKVTVEGKNTGEEPVQVTVTAAAYNGIFNRTKVTVYPSYVDPPSFTEPPKLSLGSDGFAEVSYQLDLSYPGGTREDQSQITWYRVDDAQGSNPVEAAVTRDNRPSHTYTPTSGDVGRYLMAAVTPKHARSLGGETLRAVSSRAITLEDLPGTGAAKYGFTTSFEQFPSAWQPELLPGTWTVDTHDPADQQTKWTPGAAGKAPWAYAEGINGAAGGKGLITAERGARLLYTQNRPFGDMSVRLEANPEKTAGQGFGSPNGQYLEVYIMYDTASRSGYALRIERTTKYGIATDYTLYEYVNGAGRPISDPVSTTAFNPGAVIEVWTEGNMLYAKASSSSVQSSDQVKAGLPNEVSLSAPIGGNAYGGLGIQHTGTVSAGNRTQLKRLSVTYKDAAGTESPAGESMSGARTYTVKQGDTLSSIAEGQLGGARDWVKLYEWNRHLIHDPDLIYIGQELLIRE